MHARVLIVDDQEAIAWAIREAMAAKGYDAETAGSGEEALAIVAKHGVDLVFTDLDMPGMNGIELIRKLREGGSDAGVIIMTARGSFESAVEALRLGAADYMLKPVDIEEAARAADAALKRRAAYPNSVPADSVPLAPPSEDGEDQSEPAEPGGASCLACGPVLFETSRGRDLRAFNDVMRLGPDRYGIARGEVYGDEPASALYALVVKGYLRSEALRGASPAETLRGVNRLMLDDGHDDVGVSIFYGVYGAKARAAKGHGFRYAAAGPGRWFLCSEGKRRCTELSATGPPAGILEDAGFGERSFDLAPGDRIVILDGSDPLDETLSKEVARVLCRGVAFGGRAGELSDELSRLSLEARAGSACGTGPLGVAAVVTLGVSDSAVEERRTGLPCNACGLAEVRAAGERFAARAGLRYESKHALITAAAEAAINAIRHAYDGADGTLGVSYSLAGGKAWVEVWDEGRGFDLSGYRAPNTATYDEVMRADGRGIFLMRSLMDEVEIDSDGGRGTRVRMCLGADAAAWDAA